VHDIEVEIYIKAILFLKATSFEVFEEEPTQTAAQSH
jgi:hypothetical protein